MFVIHVLAGVHPFVVVLDGVGVGMFIVVIGIVLVLAMAHLLV